MEKQKLPNQNAITVLGVLSILGSCCFGGLLGLILGIIALVMANKATNIYHENPDLYLGLGSVKTGRIMAIIGIVLSAIILLFVIGFGFYFGWDAIANPELMQERLEQMQ